MRTARRVHSRPFPSRRTTGLEPAQGIEQAPASRVEMPSLLPSEYPPRRGRLTDFNARRLGPYAASGCHPAVGIAVATAFPQVRARKGRQGLSCNRQGDVGTTQHLRRVTYAWVQDHLIGKTRIRTSGTVSD